MSNLLFPLRTVAVADPLLDWVEPVYVIKEPSSLKSFTSQDINTYSNNNITAQLNLNSTEFVLDTNINWSQPITVTINGTTSTGLNILVDNCFGLRSNALSKITNTLELKYGSTSYSYLIGSTINLMERFNTTNMDKYCTGYGLSMLDPAQTYDQLVGSSINPLGYYTSGMDVIQKRGAYPIKIVSNSPTQAVFTTTLQALIMSPPLRDQLMRGGAGAQGIAHLSNLGVNINFVGNIGNRLMSFVKERASGDELSLTNINVQIGMPTFSFTQIKSINEMIPRHISFNMSNQEYYPYSVTLPYNVPTIFNLSSFTLTSVPYSMTFAAIPSQNVYFNNAVGAFVPDCAASVSNFNVQYDGQSLFSSINSQQIYKVCVENNLVDNYVSWSGLPTLLTVGAGASPPQYINGAGGFVKLLFSKDISLHQHNTVGSSNPTSISMNVTLTNTNPLTEDFTFVLLLNYSSVIQFYDNNLCQIGNIPVSADDITNTHLSERVHLDVIHKNDLSGGGIFSNISNLLKSGSMIPVINSIKSVLMRPEVRSGFKKFLTQTGHPKSAEFLDSVGFGKHKKGGARSGGATSGGAYASHQQMHGSLFD